MGLLKTGVLATSHMEGEHRVPLYPQHLDRIAPRLRPSLVFETGYGAPFAVSDDWIAERCGGVLDRHEILSTCDAVVLVKPLESDLLTLKEGALLWGFVNCVQQRGITQIAIDRRLTLIGFEAMYRWRADGHRDMLVLTKNSEIAGYCAVLQALHLADFDGHYGPPKRAALLGFGSVCRGAVYALRGLGIHGLTVYTQRPPHLVHDPLPGCRYRRMVRGRPMLADDGAGDPRPLVEALAEVDIIVNGSVQDPDDPLMYLGPGEEDRLRPGSLIIDVSCDLGMGFPFARPTTLEEPTFGVGEVLYYGVKNTPSYLWKCASWEISQALMPYLEAVMTGPAGWKAESTVRSAIPIWDGEVRNPKILSFQNRVDAYPYPVRGD